MEKEIENVIDKDSNILLPFKMYEGMLDLIYELMNDIPEEKRFSVIVRLKELGVLDEK